MKNSNIYVTRLLIVIALLLPSILYAQDVASGSPGDNPDVDEATEMAEDIMEFYGDVGFITSDDDSESLFVVSEENAVTGVPFLDDFNPDDFFSLQSLPKGPDGGFTYLPGKWKGTVKGYCLNVGGRLPGMGDAFLTSPIVGQIGGAINSILKNSSNHPEIRQSTIQSLLWGITDGLAIDEMRPEMQDAASLLLTSEEIDHINESISNMTPSVSTEDLRLQAEEMVRRFESMEEDNVYFEDQSEIPPDFQSGIPADFQSEIQSVICGGGSYEDLEALALQMGSYVEPIGRRFPSERWSCRPDEGYFIRYFINGYQTIPVEVVIPNFFVTEYDDLGRITAINSCYGRRLEIEYDDTINPLNFGDADIMGYAFKSIRFERRADYFSGPVLVDEWNDTGWTLSGYLPSEPISAGAGSGRFSDADERLEWAFSHAEEVDGLCRIPLGQPVVVELGLLANAIQEAVGGDANDPVVEYCRESWMDALLWVMSWAESSANPPDNRMAALVNQNQARKGGGDSGSEDSGIHEDVNDIENTPLVPDDEGAEEWGMDLSGGDDWGMDLSGGGEDLEGRLPGGGNEWEWLEFDLSGGAAAGDPGNQPLGISNDPVDDPVNNENNNNNEIETTSIASQAFSEFREEQAEYLRENEIGDFWEGYKHGYFDGAADMEGAEREDFGYDQGDDYTWGYDRGMEAAYIQFGDMTGP